MATLRKKNIVVYKLVHLEAIALPRTASSCLCVPCYSIYQNVLYLVFMLSSYTGYFQYATYQIPLLHGYLFHSAVSTCKTFYIWCFHSTTSSVMFGNFSDNGTTRKLLI